MDTGHYDNEDDDPSINGWIKKEIDDDEFEDYIKQVPDIESGDRYEELMNLTKDDLVGKILQQEEDIRYLQDLRHGMEKSIQDLTSSCSEFKKLLGDMTSVLSTFKEPQPVVSSPTPPHPIPPASRAQTVPRSTASTSSAQASPRSTPNPFSASSPRPSSNPGVMNMASNTRAGTSATSVSQPTHIASSITTTDRMHAGKTVTIMRSTNVVIKTEIPSPPPDQPMLTQTVNTPIVSVGNQRHKPENQRSYQTRQQSQQRNSNLVPQSSSSSSMSFSQPSTYGKAANQGGNVNIQPRQQPAQRGRPSNPQLHVQNAATGRAANQVQRNIPNTFQKQQQQQQQQRIMQANISQSPANVTPVGGHKGQSAFNAAAGRSPALIGNASAANISRQRLQTQQPVPTSSSATTSKCTVTEITDNAPVKMPTGITLPSGLTLSIVTPKSASDQKSQMQQQQSGSDKAAISSSLSKIPFNQENNSEDGPSKNSDKSISSSNMTNASSAVSTTSATPMEEDEEDEEFYDEVAVLEPDKSSSPPMEISGGQGGEGQVSSGSGNEGFARPVEQSPESFWNSHNAPGRNDQKNAYQNNDEYMYEEDDIDSGEENDSKVYLGEDVTLPKDLVDSCMKQGPTPAKLTRNLMQALFPDLREIASGCNDGGDNSGPSLPSNKLNAIIAQVQKVYPQTKRSQIVLTMNMKCREARTQLTKNRRAHVQYSPY